MEWWKKLLYKLLFPHSAIVIVLVPVSAALLIYTFAFGDQNSEVAYASYGISAYALTVVCARAPKMFYKAKAIKEENTYKVYIM